MNEQQYNIIVLGSAGQLAVGISTPFHTTEEPIGIIAKIFCFTFSENSPALAL